MKTVQVLVAALLSATVFAGHQRMTVTFRFKGEILHATFESNVRPNQQDVEDGVRFARTSRYLDEQRRQHYFATDPDLTEAQKIRFMRGFFDWEPLSRHDDIVAIHRGPLGPFDRFGPTHLLPPQVLAMIAVDRLGDPFFDCVPGWNELTYERFLAEKRLKDRNIFVPREVAVPWQGPGLPLGVFPHWEPHVGQRYFQPENMMIGDVLQANALFADEGLWPLVHAFANFFGVLSTGRIIPDGKKKIVNGIEYVGPKVFVPTKIFWEVFNKVVKEKRRDGSRTRYYRRAQAKPVEVDGATEWVDPHLGPDTLVQLFSKSGDEFRIGWTQLFATSEKFVFVRDVEILSVEYAQYVDWEKKVHFLRQPGDPAISHQPSSFVACSDRILGRRP